MNLIVVSEPELILNKGTRNSALNDILTFYLKYNETVTYFSASEKPLEFDACGVNYCSLSSYSKQKRLIISEFFSIRKKFKAILRKYNHVHMQFRLPSLYTMQIYFIVKDLIPKSQISFYIAGDWQESLRFNYPKKLYLSKILPILQNRIIKSGTCIFTGSTLLNKNIELIDRGFAFYSTTHSKKEVPLTVTNKSQCLDICFIGRIEKLKNFDFFIELAKSKHLIKSYSFHLLGNGPELSSLKETICNDGIENVTLHGHIDDKAQFNEIIAKCKYFVLPSYTEGTSKTLPEMMCRSTIPIAFENVGSNNSILKYGNGFLAPIDDLSSVITFINEVDQNEKKYLRLLEAGNDYAKEYAIENQLKSMFEFLYMKKVI